MDPVNMDIVRGDTGKYLVQFKDNKDVLIDDSGAEYRMTAKKNQDDPDSSAIFSVTANQSSAGTATLVVPPSATRNLTSNDTWLYYDIQVTETGGDVTTIQVGILNIIPDISVTAP